MQPIQRTNYQRNRPSQNSFDYRPLIVWRLAEISGTTVAIDWQDPQPGLVVAGIPKLLRERDGAFPIEQIVTDAGLTLTFATACEADDSFALPQNDPGIRNSLGGCLAPQIVQLAQGAAPIFATLAGTSGQLLYLNLASDVVPIVSVDNPNVVRDADASTPIATTIDGSQMTLEYPGIAAIGSGEDFRLLASNRAVFNDLGGWLQPFVVHIA